MHPNEKTSYKCDGENRRVYLLLHKNAMVSRIDKQIELLN